MTGAAARILTRLRLRRTASAVAVAALALGSLTACGGGDSSSATSLVLYNGQHPSTTQALVEEFTKRTGIQVKVLSGEDPELANQILQEGSGSPADVFYTENSPALSLLSEKGMLAPVDSSTLADVPARYDSPKGDFVGIAGRETALIYNPAKIAADQLPSSLLDLAQPQWKGKVGVAPSGSDFQAIAAAVVAVDGVQAAKGFFRGLARNGVDYQSNTAILQAVNRGQVPVGITYHYYYFRDRAEGGANSGHVRLHYFGHQDAGAFLSISGAAVLKSSKHQAAAQKFLAFLAGVPGQTELAQSDDFEYPLNPKVPANPKLRPLSQLDPPKVDLSQIGDGQRTVRIMQEAGLI